MNFHLLLSSVSLDLSVAASNKNQAARCAHKCSQVYLVPMLVILNSHDSLAP